MFDGETAANDGDATESPAELGLRERKKLRTRETIQRVALELFERQGFNATTIPQIAAAAEVSPRTVSAYFPVKEDLVFFGAEEQFDRLEERLAERRPGETSADALREWIATELPKMDKDAEEVRRRRALVDSEEALQAHEHRVRARAERLLAQAVADDLGMTADDLEPRMAAAATAAVFEVIGKPGRHGDGENAVSHLGHGEEECSGPQLHAEALVLIDRGLTFIAGGIRALASGDRPDPPAS